jgi:polysaccharide deacetylase 2 family uncharacterized protein YibQ
MQKQRTIIFIILIIAFTGVGIYSFINQKEKTDILPEIMIYNIGLANFELDLPQEAGIGIVPYANSLNSLMSQYAKQHLVFLNIPLENFDYGIDNLGQYVILMNDTNKEQKFKFLLDKLPSNKYGIYFACDEIFTSNEDSSQWLVNMLEKYANKFSKLSYCDPSGSKPFTQALQKSKITNKVITITINIDHAISVDDTQLILNKIQNSDKIAMVYKPAQIEGLKNWLNTNKINKFT